MEERPRMSEAKLQTLLWENARRCCAGSTELSQHQMQTRWDSRRCYSSIPISASRFRHMILEDSEEASRQGDTQTAAWGSCCTTYRHLPESTWGAGARRRHGTTLVPSVSRCRPPPLVRWQVGVEFD